MYRILLVEDEQLALDVLKDHTDWASLDIKVVCTAMNGLAALECLEKFQPDIVMTDVKMPIMDGITFARKARDRFPKIKIIFMSAYNEFDIVKQAVNLDAAAYILKPIEDEELREVMEKVKSQCKEEERYAHALEALEQKLLRDLLLEQEDMKKAVIIEEYKNLQKKWVHFVVLCFSIDGFQFTKEDQVRIVEKKLKYYIECWNPAGFIYAMGSGIFCCLKPVLDTACLAELLQKEAEALQIDILRDAGISLTTSTDGKLYGLTEISKAFSNTIASIGRRFYEGYGHFFLAESMESESHIEDISLKPYIETIICSIRKRDMQQVEHEISNFFDELAQMRMQEEATKRITYDLLKKIVQILAPQNESGYSDEYKSVLWKEIERQDTLEALRIYSKEWIPNITDAYTANVKDRHTDAVKKVITLLEENEQHLFTIEELASRVYLSPNYLRAIFKRVTNESISEMQLRIRMEKAEKLLEDSRLKIKDISKKLGYEYTSHFIALFVKHKGMSPAKYRSRFINKDENQQ